VEISSYMPNCNYVEIFFHVYEIITEIFFRKMIVAIFSLIYIAIGGPR